MKKVKVLSLFTVFCLSLSLFSTYVFAANFNDVDSTKYIWAEKQIKDMASKGIIKGYDDGTFKPEKTVSNLESLVLVSRILGVNDDENANLLDAAIEKYSSVVKSYNINFGENEIAYLLIKNVISEKDLDTYLANNKAAQGMKRYEVAILLTKAMGADAEVSKNVITSLEYSDAESIPSAAKKYVEYVTNIGFMQGMGNNEFSPNTEVTRAQIAVLLSKLIDKASYSFVSVQVYSMDSTLRSIKVKSDTKMMEYTLDPTVALRFEGTPITINDIAAGYDAVVTLSNGNLFSMDFITPLLDDEIYGSVTGTKSSSNGEAISIVVTENSAQNAMEGDKLTFSLAKKCVISNNGEKVELNSLKPSTYVKVTVKSGKVSAITVLNANETITGRIENLSITPVVTFTVENTEGSESTYYVADEVTVTRNGTKAELSQVVAGDSGSITLKYGKITKMVLTSKTQAKSGTITEIIISVNPKITLKIDGIESTYAVSNSCEIKNSAKPESTFYDLRAGASATVTFSGDTITKIETDVSEGVTQISGTVVAVNSAYNLIQISYVDSASGNAVTEPVFVKAKTSIIDIGTGASIKISNINIGDKVSAFGTRNTGVFQATAVNVTKN